jgi:MFS family permease
LAVALSAAGDMLLVVVLALRVHDVSGSGFAVAALFGALMLPVVLLAPVAGRLVDGFETRRVLLLVSLAQLVVAGGLVFADDVAPILVLTALVGAGAAIAGPAEAALVPAAAAGGDLARANGWVETARYTGFTAGPLIAAGLTAAGGTELGLAANALSFAAVALAAATLRARRAPARQERAARASGAASPDAAALLPGAAPARGRNGGLGLLLADPVLRPTLGAAVGALLFISAVMTAEVFYVRDVVGAGAAGYSLVYAGWMAGMVVGAVGIAARVKAPLAVAGLLALALQGAGVAVAAVWPVLAFVLACNVAGGIGHGVKNVLLRTLIQQRVPAAAHGRAFAAYGAARNFAEIGALASGGVIIALFGPQVAMLIAGLGPVVAAAAGLVWIGVASGNAPGRRIGLKVRAAAADS